MKKLNGTTQEVSPTESAAIPQSFLAEVTKAASSNPAKPLVGSKQASGTFVGSTMLNAVPARSASMAQRSLSAAAHQLNTVTRTVHPVSTTATSQSSAQSAAAQNAFVLTGSLTFDPNHQVFSVLEYTNAVKAIQSKAVALGYGAASQSVSVTGVPGGYMGHLDNNDIYVATGGHAFEVHGAIRAKYDALGGATGALGLPTTDETGTPDGVGRFNHFDHGSIYWTPRTGPMTVRGTVRNRWAASGWERGPLGYPVQDQHRMALLGPLPLVEWCLFENGVIAGDIRSAMPAPMALQSPAETLGRIAPPALLTYAELGDIFGNRFNEQFKASPDNVALRHGIELTGVSDWQYDMWSSTPRSLGFRLHGFHDNGLATDTNFVIDIRLRFQLVANNGPSFTEPIEKTLIAVLDHVDVGHDGGLALAQVYASVESAILHTFISSDGGPVDPNHPEVPSGAIFLANVPTGADLRTGAINILDVLVTAAGDLQILVNPLTPPQLPLDPTTSYTYLRQFALQDILDSLA